MNRAESALSAPLIVSLASLSLADSVPLTTKRRSARALKRSALVASGRFYIWSVTHDDVTKALSGDPTTDLESPLVALTLHSGEAATAVLPRAQQNAFTHNAVTLLLQYLATPISGVVDPAAVQLRKNAMWLNFLMIPSNEQEKQWVDTGMNQWMPQLPQVMRSPGTSHAPCMSKKDAQPIVMAWWPLSYSKSQDGMVDSPGLVFLDDSSITDNKQLRCVRPAVGPHAEEQTKTASSC